jgi:ankyrin repeat protein
MDGVIRYEDPAALSDLFIRLACLTYGDWHRSNASKARRLLADHPALATADLYCAAAAGDVAAVRAAIERDPALVNVKGGPLGWEPLLYACYSRLDDVSAGRSTLEVARLLLAQGADPNAGYLWCDRYPCTALTGAFGRGEDWINELPHPGCDSLARLLLDAGADPNDGQVLYNRHFRENDDHLTLLFSYGLGQGKGGPWLSRNGDSDDTLSAMLVQELCWAAQHGFASRVRLLIEHGVDVNVASGRDGRTPYQAALREGHQAMAEYLLLHGAIPVDPDPLETFALACIAGRREDVRARLARDPTLLTKLGEHGRLELLHRAVNASQPDGVRLLVELGADVNEMIPDTWLDRAVLHEAAGSDLEMVELLLGLGADPQLRDLVYHAAPIGWALYSGRRDIVEYLLRFATIFDAVRSDGVDRVAELIEADSPLALATDDDGDPVAFYLHSEMTRLEEMIQVFATHGVSLNARSRTGATLLDRARARGALDFADALRAHGARTAAELAPGS